MSIRADESAGHWFNQSMAEQHKLSALHSSEHSKYIPENVPPKNKANELFCITIINSEFVVLCTTLHMFINLHPYVSVLQGSRNFILSDTAVSER